MKDHIQEIVIGCIFLIGLIAAGFYGIWYWNNCAFVPYADAPMLCHSNTTTTTQR